MCGNDISTIPVPGQDFIDLIEPQMSRGMIKIRKSFIKRKKTGKSAFHK
jgi:hypothetical protein